MVWGMLVYSRSQYDISLLSVRFHNLIKIKPPVKIIFLISLSKPGPRSAVGNVSGNSCESYCRSRGREFDPGLVPYFRGD